MFDDQINVEKDPAFRFRNGISHMNSTLHSYHVKGTPRYTRVLKAKFICFWLRFLGLRCCVKALSSGSGRGCSSCGGFSPEQGPHWLQRVGSMVASPGL